MGASESSELSLQYDWMMRRTTQLDLGGKRLSYEGASAVGEALKTNTTLVELNLRGNYISSEGVYEIALSLHVNITLRSLNLGDNELGESGALLIAAALKVNQSLTELGMQHNWILSEGAEAVAEALKINNSLIALDLFGNDICSDGFQAIASALKVNRTLRQLNLEGNQICDQGVIALADAVMINKSLMELDGDWLGPYASTILGLPLSCERCSNTELLQYLRPHNDSVVSNESKGSWLDSTTPDGPIKHSEVKVKPSRVQMPCSTTPQCGGSRDGNTSEWEERDVRPVVNIPVINAPPLPPPPLPLPHTVGSSSVNQFSQGVSCVNIKQPIATSSDVNSSIGHMEPVANEQTASSSSHYAAGVDRLWPRDEVEVMKLQIGYFEVSSAYNTAKDAMDFAKLKILRAEKHTLSMQLSKRSIKVWPQEDLYQRSIALCEQLEKRCRELIDDDITDTALEAAEACHIALLDLRQKLLPENAPYLNTLRNFLSPASQESISLS